MKKLSDRAMVLSRRDYGERDRIITVLSKEHGKINLIAKASRSTKSKLAGGIELFSEVIIGFIVGRSELYTLTSSRLERYFDKLVEDMDVTTAVYDMLNNVSKITQQGAGQEYYDVLYKSMSALNSQKISLGLVRVWSDLQFMKFSGTSINLKTDSARDKLDESAGYNFDFDKNCFDEVATGSFKKEHIKLLRLLDDSDEPLEVKATAKVIKDSAALTKQLIKNNLLD